MKKIILILLISIATLSAAQALKFNVKPIRVGNVSTNFLDSDLEVYKVCLEGRWYYFGNGGYQGTLATVWEEIDHPVLGKIDQPAKCKE